MDIYMKKLNLFGKSDVDAFRSAIEDAKSKGSEYITIPYMDILASVSDMASKNEDHIIINSRQRELAANAVERALVAETDFERKNVLLRMFCQLMVDERKYREFYGNEDSIVQKNEPHPSNKSTVSMGDAGGVPVIEPNKVLLHTEEQVELGGKKYDGWYISYNNYDIKTYGCDTTAIVLGQMQFFLVLNGNHTKALVQAALDGGLDACLSYFTNHEEDISKFSDMLEKVDEIER